MLSTAPAELMTWFPNQRVPVCNISEWTGELDILVATGWSTAFWLYEVPSKAKCYFVQSDETRFHPDDSRWQHITALTYFLKVNYLTEAKWIKCWLKENFGHHAALIPNGLDPEIFHPCSPLTPKGVKPRILLEGAIGLPYKGMAEAFAAVNSMDVEVWCVSSYGQPKPEWKCDRFFEHVPMKDMKKIYSSCDILLKLSRVEGFFGPPMEMMACGGVSVVGKVTGYDEYIVNESNALVVEPEDIEAARAAVERLINDTTLRNRLIESGRRTADEWRWDSSIDELERYYEEILSKPDRCTDFAQRAKHHRSIVYAYTRLSQALLDNEISSARVENPLPPHVQRLAAIMANSHSFLLFSNAIRYMYRMYRNILRRPPSL